MINKTSLEYNNLGRQQTQEQNDSPREDLVDQDKNSSGVVSNKLFDIEEDDEDEKDKDKEEIEKEKEKDKEEKEKDIEM